MRNAIVSPAPARAPRVLAVVGSLVTIAVSGCAPNTSPGGSASSATHGGAAGAGGGSGEILWDRYGVPHIFAASDEQLAHGFGHAQMRSHADLLLQLYGQGRGRAAEYWGGEHRDSDRWVRLTGIPARAAEWYAQQSPAFRRYLDAFAAGINAYARAHPDAIADSLEVVLPVTAIDVLAHGQRVINLVFVGNTQGIEAQLRRWRGQGAGSGAEGEGTGERQVDAPFDAPSSPGSNAWAIAPSRSASGRAMLVANPHLPWGDLFTWFEAQLVGPGIDVYGATLVGSPVIAIGFNARLGWTHTVNTYDGSDLYELVLADGGYRFDGAVRPFETHTDTIRVKRADGTIAIEPLTVKRSVHGPVVEERGDRAIALRLAGLDRSRAAEQWWEMGRARTLAEFEGALRRMQLPMFTVMYADADGRILHLFNGQVPARPRGDAAYWSGIVPGDSAATLWTRTLGYDELPRLVDPRTGWLQNANDPPWTTTIPLDASIAPSRYPTHVAPRGMAFRPQRSARLLAEAPERISFEELVRRKHDTRLEIADRIVDDLLPAARANGGELARQGADVLARWDRSADADSRGGVLFAAWWRELLRRSRGSPFATPWSPDRPLATPDGLADTAAAVRALENAAADVQRRHGALDVAWGQVHRLRRDTVDLPANGATGGLGVFRVVDFGDPNAPRATALGGDSFVFVAEFGATVRAQALVGYGNASQPGSPHRVDQLPYMARKALRPVWRTRAEIEANLASRTRY